MRLVLAEDYNPGDTKIYVTGNPAVLFMFPPTGLITLTEQCSDIGKRAITLSYNAVDTVNGVISGLVLEPGFPDVVKPARITDVVENVMAKHHNNLKDALIAIQNFIGVKGTIDTRPFGPTLEGRINFLRKLVLVPRAWFTMNVRQGITPLEVEFTDRSFRLGTDGTAGPVIITWDFGDQTSSNISYNTISDINTVPSDDVDVIVREDTPGGTVLKTYTRPGIYTVKMTVQNDFGSDQLILDDVIHARVKAPNNAVIYANGVNPPQIRTPINTLISFEVPPGLNRQTPGYSYAGEPLDENGNPLDPVDNWTWSLADDMIHENSNSTVASYGIGGIYDLKLRVDTTLGAYRITTDTNAIDIVENTNLWLWVHQDAVSVRSYEFGLMSETFKLTDANTLIVAPNDSFLDGVNNEAQQKQEFSRNIGFIPRSSSTGSGAGGSNLLYWASGRNATDPIGAEKINVVEYYGFTGTYVASYTPITRPWNWCFLPGVSYSYFFGGEVSPILPNTSPVNTDLTQQNVTTMASTTAPFSTSNYLNGARELQSNPSQFDDDGVSTYGDFSVYRTAWHGSTGYIARNDSVGPFFRIKSFYNTSGSIGSPVTNIVKLTDVEGPILTECELADMSQGIYVFNNSGSVVSYNPSGQTWLQGGPGANSSTFRSLQDSTVEGFDSTSNTLLAASDHNSATYISFDYSQGAFIKFTEVNTTFSTLGSRPAGVQWTMAVY